MRRLYSDLTGMTKRSPRMVIRSSWVLPPSARRRKVLRRLSSIVRCWRSISRRIRRRSGEASSLSEPSGFRRDRSERARWANCAPAGNSLSAFNPVSWAATASGGLLDQRLPGGDVVHQKKQVANLFRLQQRPLDPRLVGQLWWDRTSRPARAPHPGPAAGASRPPGRAGDQSRDDRATASRQAATPALPGNVRSLPPAPADGSTPAPRSCILPRSTGLALKGSLDHARASR